MKSFDKYVRNDSKDEHNTADFVCSRKIREDIDYSIVPKSLWNFLSACFGVDYTLLREKDSSKTSYFKPIYRIFHEDHLKLMILPPVN